MDLPVVWTLNAVQDQLAIYEYWFSVSGDVAYIRKLDRVIRQRIATIQRFPYSGHPLVGTPDRYVLFDSYQLIYRPTADRIILLQIWDTRRAPHT